MPKDMKCKKVMKEIGWEAMEGPSWMKAQPIHQSAIQQFPPLKIQVANSSAATSCGIRPLCLTSSRVHLIILEWEVLCLAGMGHLGI